MGTAKIKCPKCGRQMLKRTLRLLNGKCPKCGCLVLSSKTRFSTARSRVQSKYRIH